LSSTLPDDAIASQRPHDVFLLPPLLPPRREGLTIVILADGNQRHGGACRRPGPPADEPSAARGPNGYAAGARRVVSIAEHLAGRGGVRTMAACILSPENVAKRSQGFFLQIYREMVRLGVAVEAEGALVRSGVELAIHGDLGPLRARGGHAAALADAMEAVARRTARVDRPALRLLLGVGYGPDIADELGADLVLRTGMEEEGVLRLSGLHTGARTIACATSTLWPDVDAAWLDEVIGEAARRSRPTLAAGYDAAAIAEIAAALDAAELPASVRVTIPATATGAAAARSPGRHAITVVRAVPGAGGTLGAGCRSVIAPGQDPPFFLLPDWLCAGHADVIACDPTPRGIAIGVREAVRFAAAHPALQGAEREAAGVPLRDAGADPGAGPADVFAARMMAWAESAGLLPGGAPAGRAFFNYALTAFFMHQGGGPRWEDGAELSARYMMLVAAGDEGVFDRAAAGEDRAARVARLEAAAGFLRDALGAEGVVEATALPDARLLAAIAGGFREIAARRRPTCHPAAFAAWRAGLLRLWAASVAEHRPDAGGERLARMFREGGAAAADAASAIVERCATSPACVRARVRAILAQARGGRRLGEAEEAELRVLGYLAAAGDAMGSGLLFRTAAIACPASGVTDAMLAALDDTAALLDHGFRLANDLSGFLSSPGGDRDDKINTCSMLVPPDALGVARGEAVLRAAGTTRRLAAWIEEETARALARLGEVWPAMATLIRRGVFVGKSVYERGHYTTLGRAEMAAIGEAVARS
jgi:hypothetical protein